MASQLAPFLFAVLAALPGAAQSPTAGGPGEQAARVRVASPIDVGPGLVFGSVPVGATTPGQPVTIQNKTAGTVTVTTLRLAGTADV